MNKPASRMEMLKMIGGTIIVLAAALIMFPGFLGLAFGLVRILLMIVVAGGACLFLAKMTQKIKRKATGTAPGAEVSATDSTETSAPATNAEANLS